MILVSIPIFFFVVLPGLFVSPAIGGTLWIADIILLTYGYVGRKKEAQEERIRRTAQLAEEGRQRAIEQIRERAQLEEEGRLRARQDLPPQQVVKETIIKERVLITCRSCGNRYPQGTLRCVNCGASL